MFDDLNAIHPRFRYTGERTRYIAFPLGGIGAGGFAISGSGRLVDWSIRNRPGLQSFNGYSHFAIKAEQGGKVLDARVLLGRESSMTLPLAMDVLRGYLGSGNLSVVMAAMSMSILPVVLLFLVAQKMVIQGVTFSGIRG